MAPADRCGGRCVPALSPRRHGYAWGPGSTCKVAVAIRSLSLGPVQGAMCSWCTVGCRGPPLGCSVHGHARSPSHPPWLVLMAFVFMNSECRSCVPPTVYLSLTTYVTEVGCCADLYKTKPSNQVAVIRHLLLSCLLSAAVNNHLTMTVGPQNSQMHHCEPKLRAHVLTRGSEPCCSLPMFFCVRVGVSVVCAQPCRGGRGQGEPVLMPPPPGHWPSCTFQVAAKLWL